MLRRSFLALLMLAATTLPTFPMASAIALDATVVPSVGGEAIVVEYDMSTGAFTWTSTISNCSPAVLTNGVIIKCRLADVLSTHRTCGVAGLMQVVAVSATRAVTGWDECAGVIETCDTDFFTYPSNNGFCQANYPPLFWIGYPPWWTYAPPSNYVECGGWDYPAPSIIPPVGEGERALTLGVFTVTCEFT